MATLKKEFTVSLIHKKQVCLKAYKEDVELHVIKVKCPDCPNVQYVNVSHHIQAQHEELEDDPSIGRVIRLEQCLDRRCKIKKKRTPSFVRINGSRCYITHDENKVNESPDALRFLLRGAELIRYLADGIWRVEGQEVAFVAGEDFSAIDDKNVLRKLNVNPMVIRIAS